MHAERDIFYQFCLSVRLSVCLSNAGTVSIWNGHIVKLFDILVGESFCVFFFYPHRHYKNSKGNPLGGGDKYKGAKILQISPIIAETVRDRAIYTNKKS